MVVFSPQTPEIFSRIVRFCPTLERLVCLAFRIVLLELLGPVLQTLQIAVPEVLPPVLPALNLNLKLLVADSLRLVIPLTMLREANPPLAPIDQANPIQPVIVECSPPTMRARTILVQSCPPPDHLPDVVLPDPLPSFRDSFHVNSISTTSSFHLPYSPAISLGFALKQRPPDGTVTRIPRGCPSVPSPPVSISSAAPSTDLQVLL
mmetsp:Transcript_10407/g.23799  ORF Transcript_10407/g.23799 Transcript_10407/m.23799 type:complete len:206 (-) Transcript_10407:2573-3190(-)